MSMSALESFAPATRQWFAEVFGEPTAAQAGAWDAVRHGTHTLVVAPTGSGKTLAAFLSAIDRIFAEPAELRSQRFTRVVYVSPLKALAVDVERNLRAPLAGIARVQAQYGSGAADVSGREITIGVRTGDTTAAQRAQQRRNPPDILVTTPESLYLLITSQARENLVSAHTIIIDEIHAVAGSKRGAHLAVTLERLEELVAAPSGSRWSHTSGDQSAAAIQRIGLSATVADADAVAEFMAGSRPVSIVRPRTDKHYELSVRVPVEDMSDPGTTESPVDAPAGSAGQGSIWPHIERQIVDLITEHRSTLVFVNSRRLAERLTARINEIHAADRDPTALPPQPLRPPAQMMVQSEMSRGAATDLAMAHHGSVSKERRAEIEQALKAGDLRAVVATSSLELGIDMGAVDLVIQVEAPMSVASGLQRIGRAGHNVGDISRAVIFPKHRADLVHCAVVTEQMLDGNIEPTTPIRNPLDVLSQQTIAGAAMDDLDVEAWFSLLRRTATFASLPRAVYEATLDMLAGKYPSTDFSELRPRIIWDREAGILRGRPGAQRLAVTSGGTIADRGMFGVFMVGEKTTRVGELDEEMVYESRVGDVFTLGASSWRIEEITHDRVLVTPAPAHSGRLPFWIAEDGGRPTSLGQEIGAFLRELASDPAKVSKRCTAIGLNASARDNLLRYIDEQINATGVLPTDRTIVVERFRDEVGDWRIVIHTPYGARVHWPWAEAIRARLATRHGFDAVPVVSDDGIVLRVPDMSLDDVSVLDLDGPPLHEGTRHSALPGAADIVFESAEAVDLITSHVPDTAVFAARFRECAARALLLPRLNPGKRAPLWQQRQKASQLLSVARQYPDFPIILEAMREVLQDVYDVPALEEVLDRIARKEIKIVEVESRVPSPFAASVMFDYVGAFVYEGDSPVAERAAAALSIDSTLLGQLLGRIELRELLDPEILTDVENRLQHRVESYYARDAEGVADLLRLLGPLTATELLNRTTATDSTELATWLDQLATHNRAATVSYANNNWWVASEDLGRLRDALGVPPPPGTAAAFLESGDDPLAELVRRYARTHGPFTEVEIAARFGIGVAVARSVLDRETLANQLVVGEFRPGESGVEWCDAEVLRMIRRRSLAALREAIEPVEPAALGRFLPAWQGIGTGNTERGIDGLLAICEQLDGVPLPLSAWEPLVLTPRMQHYQPGDLDELLASGELMWCGRGRSGARDGLISLHPADSAPLTVPAADISAARSNLSPLATAVLTTLTGSGGLFFRDIVAAVAAHTRGQSLDLTVSEVAIREALWELAWAGLVTNDTFAPLRAVLAGALPLPGIAGRATSSQAHRAPAAGRGSRRRAPRLGRSRLGSTALLGGSTAGVGGTIGTGLRTPPVVAGRWSTTPTPESDPTLRAHATAELLLSRYGVLTRGSVEAESAPGGFAGVYKILTAMEDAGGPRRGYFVEGLGAAQFADGATIDRLRAVDRNADNTRWATSDATPEPVLLAATDPANPYGAALPWPDSPNSGDAPTRARAARKAGSIVVLVDGLLTVYLERGGKTALIYSEREEAITLAIAALTTAVRENRIAGFTLGTINGITAAASPWAGILKAHGFSAVPQGLRVRASSYINHGGRHA